jgi:serine/threonine-protein kinase
MELVHGETVKARIQRSGAMPVKLALHIVRQIASALDYARQMATVHRDVKPDNIIVTDDGKAKLVDFGLAKSVVKAGRSGVTRVGDVLGTLAYMSPEQIDSSITADHRSDIYSLGATLYHMVAGRIPFEASRDFDYMRKIQSEESPDVRQVRPDVPPIVGALIARCMRKRPGERYETAGEIVRLASTLLASGESRSTVS